MNEIMMTADLIQAGVSANTQRAYRYSIEKLEAWRGERTMDDGRCGVSRIHHPSTHAGKIARNDFAGGCCC